MEKLSDDAKAKVVARIGELTVLQNVLRNACTELHAIEEEYMRALEQPQMVAADTLAPLPDRINAINAWLYEQVGPPLPVSK